MKVAIHDTFTSMSNYAAEEARAPRQPEISEGQNNALRHAIWQFLLACRFGVDRARTIGDIHEDVSTDPCDTAIDQYNNQRARELATPERCWPFQGPSVRPEDLNELVEDLIRRMNAGEFVTSKTDPRVIPPCPKP